VESKPKSGIREYLRGIKIKKRNIWVRPKRDWLMENEDLEAI
jgi:hypothetical protein